MYTYTEFLELLEAWRQAQRQAQTTRPPQSQAWFDDLPDDEGFQGLRDLNPNRVK